MKDSSSTDIDAETKQLSKIKDYKKTSLVEAISVFENFLKGIEIKNPNKDQGKLYLIKLFNL